MWIIWDIFLVNHKISLNYLIKIVESGDIGDFNYKNDGHTLCLSVFTWNEQILTSDIR